MRDGRGPQVNLLAHRRRLPPLRRWWRAETGLAVVAAAVWLLALLAIALLLGWHPPVAVP